jgi:hypothetical protein
LFVQGNGPNPVGNIEVFLGTKAGAAAAVLFGAGRRVYTAIGLPGGRLGRPSAQLTDSAGKIVIPAASVVAAFVYGILLDVPVLPDDATDLVMRVRNAGTTGTALIAVGIGEQPRY